MEKHSVLAWGHEDLNLSHPRRQPLLPGKKPGRGFASATREQFPGQKHRHSSKTPTFNLGGRGRGGSLRLKPSCAATHTGPVPRLWTAAPTANRIVPGAQRPRVPPAGDKKTAELRESQTHTHGCAAKLGTGCWLFRVFGGGRGVGCAHGYGRNGGIGWFYSSGLLLQGKKPQ